MEQLGLTLCIQSNPIICLDEKSLISVAIGHQSAQPSINKLARFMLDLEVLDLI